MMAVRNHIFDLWAHPVDALELPDIDLAINQPVLIQELGEKYGWTPAQVAKLLEIHSIEELYAVLQTIQDGYQKYGMVSCWGMPTSGNIYETLMRAKRAKNVN
jgi:hypothetical protein